MKSREEAWTLGVARSVQAAHLPYDEELMVMSDEDGNESTSVQDGRKVGLGGQSRRRSVQSIKNFFTRADLALCLVKKHLETWFGHLDTLDCCSYVRSLASLPYVWVLSQCTPRSELIRRRSVQTSRPRDARVSRVRTKELMTSGRLTLWRKKFSSGKHRLSPSLPRATCAGRPSSRRSCVPRRRTASSPCTAMLVPRGTSAGVTGTTACDGHGRGARSPRPPWRLVSWFYLNNVVGPLRQRPGTRGRSSARALGQGHTPSPTLEEGAVNHARLDRGPHRHRPAAHHRAVRHRAGEVTHVNLWVALVDEEGPLHKPLKWQPPFVRRFQSPSFHAKRDSVGEVRTMMWRGPRDPARALPRDRASRAQPLTVRVGDTFNITWDIGMNWHDAPGLPVSLQYAVEDVIERWAAGDE